MSLTCNTGYAVPYSCNSWCGVRRSLFLLTGPWGGCRYCSPYCIHACWFLECKPIRKVVRISCYRVQSSIKGSQETARSWERPLQSILHHFRSKRFSPTNAKIFTTHATFWNVSVERRQLLHGGGHALLRFAPFCGRGEQPERKRCTGRGSMFIYGFIERQSAVCYLFVLWKGFMIQTSQRVRRSIFET